MWRLVIDQMGYFSQEIEEMNKNQRVIDYIKDVAEYIPTGTV